MEPESLFIYCIYSFIWGGRGSVVGIPTRYGIEVPGIEFRWRRYLPTCQTSPETHPASCKMGTGSFPEARLSGLGVNHPSPSSAEITNGLGIYLPLPSVPVTVYHEAAFTFTTYLFLYVPALFVYLFIHLCVNLFVY
jgi:hypothetical protein